MTPAATASWPIEGWIAAKHELVIQALQGRLLQRPDAPHHPVMPAQALDIRVGSVGIHP